MAETVDNTRDGQYLVLVPMASVTLFCLLYYLRFLDDNRLTSWKHVFENADMGVLTLLVIVASAIAAWASKYKLPGPNRLFALSFLLHAFFWNQPEVIVDASRYFTQAKHLELYGISYFLSHWGHDIVAWTDMPLIPYIFGMGFSIFGEHRVVSQCIVGLMLSASITLTVLFMRDMFRDESLARLSGFLILAISYLYSQSPLLMVDVPSMFFLVTSFYLYNRLLMRGGIALLLLAAIFISATIFVKYSLWLMLSVLAALMCVHLILKTERAVRRTALLAMAVIVLALPVFWYFREIIQTQMQLLIEYQKPGLSRWGESFISTLLFQSHPFLAVGTIASVYMAIRKRDIRYLAIFWLVALIMAMQIKRSRYLIPVLPFYAMSAAYGLQMIKSRQLQRAIALNAVAASFIVAAFAYMPFLATNNLANLKDAARLLNKTNGTVKVQTLAQRSSINPAVAVPILDIYLDNNIIYNSSHEPPISAERLAKSPYRFTWTYMNPLYYMSEGDFQLYAVITPSRSRAPADYGRRIESFNISERIYRYRTFVDIYEKDD